MCGRATLTSPAEDVAEIFDVAPIDIGPPRFNIAPTQPILTVRPSSVKEPADDGEKPKRELALVRWGLIPWWAKEDEAKKIASKCIQARAETAPKAPAFRDAFRRHRCLVIVDGFFEWKTLPDGRRVPHHVHLKNKAPFAIAGVWDAWGPKKKASGDNHEADQEEEQQPERIESATVLTTRSGGPVRDLHTRMPLVLAANEWDTWLDGSPEAAEQLLENAKFSLDERARELLVIPVSTWVNDVKHDDPQCVVPVKIEEAKGQTQFAFAVAGSAAKRAKATTKKKSRSR